MSYKVLEKRGPDESVLLEEDEMVWGFHRLQIHGISTKHGQPFQREQFGPYEKIIAMANAEIYNYEGLKEIYVDKDETPYETESDCEILLHMRKKLVDPVLFMNSMSCECAGMVYTKEKGRELVWVFRDPLGVRSLYWGRNESGYCFASEMKGIPKQFEKVEMFPAGSIWVMERLDGRWEICEQYKYYQPNWKHTNMMYLDGEEPSQEWLDGMKEKFMNAVQERLTSDRPIGCLLSGGLDSSLVAALVQREGKKMRSDFCVRTFSIGLENSPDLYYARKVAEWIGSEHTEWVVSEEELLENVKETIYAIESYCVTTVRASTANYLVSKKIKEETDIAVLFCGDVSDEVYGSYRGCQKAPNGYDFYRVNVELLEKLPWYDLLRSDKSISSNGLEGRVPFADRDFIDHVMEGNPMWKMFGDERMEKYWLRSIFEGDGLLRYYFVGMYRMRYISLDCIVRCRMIVISEIILNGRIAVITLL